MAVPRACRRNRSERVSWSTAFVAAIAITAVASGSSSADSDPLAALLARTDAIAKQVAKHRGLPLKKKIEQEVVDREELRARLMKLAAEQKTQTETRAEGL